jgi:hypothetical protein
MLINNSYVIVLICLLFSFFFTLFIGIIMGSVEIIDLSSDDESEKVAPVATVKLEPEYVTGAEKRCLTGDRRLTKHKKSRSRATRHEADENVSYSNSSVLEQGPSPVDDTGISYASSICPAPLSRQFWKAGNYDDGVGSQITVQG